MSLLFLAPHGALGLTPHCSTSWMACASSTSRTGVSRMVSKGPPGGSRYYAPRAPSKYQRAEGDNEPVDEAKVTKLLNQRAALRSAKNFDDADRVLDMLQAMRVRVSDQARAWYVDGYGGRPSGVFDAPRSGAGTPSMPQGRGSAWPEGRTGPLPRARGYTRVPGDDDRPIDLERVRSLLATRFAMRSARDFDGADRVREELRSLGVTVSDKEMTWKCSGGRRGGWEQRGAGLGDSRRDEGYERRPRYGRRGGGEEVSDERANEKGSAPSARGDGWDGYALVDDGWRSPYETNEWESERGQRGRRGASAQRGGNARDSYGRGVDGGHARGAGRSNGYADARGGARGRYEEERWDDRSPRGPQGQRKPSPRRGEQAKRQREPAAPYTRAADCAAVLGAAELAEIDGLVAERLAAKLRKDFRQADELLRKLEARGVSVSDDARNWRADGQSFIYQYSQEAGARRVDVAAAIKEAEWLIGKRGQARHGMGHPPVMALGRSGPVQ